MRRLMLVLICAVLVALTASYAVHVRAQAGDLKVEATPNQLWPPNDKMIRIRLDGYCGGSTGIPGGFCLKGYPCNCCEALQILGVSSNEPIVPGVDYEFSDTCVYYPAGPELWLKSARAEEGPGRKYHIQVRECDGEGCCAERTRTVTVTVPHDQRQR